VKHLFLVRHAQSAHHVLDFTGGWTDLPLTALGRRQAERAAARLKSLIAGHPVSLFSSDLVRAAMTAEAIALRLGVSPVLDPGLRELDNGEAAGLSSAAARAIARPQSEPLIDWQHYPGAETWRQMTDRTAACMDRLGTQAQATVIVVAHGGSGTAVIKWWLGLPESCRHSINFELAPASISELLDNEWRERMVVRLNDTAHLEPLLQDR
jgi:broad specificity phosphatase PhoE